MNVCERIRTLRNAKSISQGEVEKRTGLLRCYTSRVETGHTVPAVETLEKSARALEVPLSQLFYEGAKPPLLPKVPKKFKGDTVALEIQHKDARFTSRLLRLLGKIKESVRRLLMHMARKTARETR